jgi:hypothetical protein
LVTLFVTFPTLWFDEGWEIVLFIIGICQFARIQLKLRKLGRRVTVFGFLFAVRVFRTALLFHHMVGGALFFSIIIFHNILLIKAQ